MELQSTYNVVATLGAHRYEVEVEVYKTIKRVFFRRLGWACWNDTTIRGKDYKANEIDYMRKHIAVLDFSYHVKD